MSPRVSIVMPVYNGERFLHQAVNSILQQTFHNFEFIIIDDGSTDNTWSILNAIMDTRIRLFRQENAGVAAALNRGIELAYGEFIARIDSDDIAFPKRLERQVSYLDQFQDVGVLGTAVVKIDRNGSWLRPYVPAVGRDAVRKMLLTNSPFVHSTVMMRTRLVQIVGGYPNCFGIEDYMLWKELAEISELDNLPNILGLLRSSLESVTNDSQYENAMIIPKFRYYASKGCNAMAEGEVGLAKKFFVKGLRNAPEDLNLRCALICVSFPTPLNKFLFRMFYGFTGWIRYVFVCVTSFIQRIGLVIR